MVIRKILSEKIKNAPSCPGVYIYKDEKGVILYIGKAINLRRRLLYYTKNRDELFPKVANFLELAFQLNWIEVETDLEALLLEMNLIRSLKPKYNALSRDDKRPLLIHFTNDKFPRIKTARLEISGNGDYIGPFPSSYKLSQILKKLRKIFPYCSCSNKTKTCLYYDLGLCLGISGDGKDIVNSKFKAQNSKIENIKSKNLNQSLIQTESVDIRISEYKKNIRRLKLFLNGKIGKVIKILEKEMKEFSDGQEYEKANKVKGQIEDIKLLLSSTSSIEEYLKNDLIKNKLAISQNNALALMFNLPNIERIEGYDIANTSGTLATASMVVFENGIPNTNEYRKFKIKTTGPNDPAMIYEVLKRRLEHDQWQMPDLILVDGGKTQVGKARQAICEKGLSVKIVGLAKKFDILVIPNEKDFSIVKLPVDKPELVLLRAVRDEAHRFATNYHKKLREKAMIN